MTVQAAIESKLREELSPTHLQVINDSDGHSVPKGSETHFTVVVVSEKFKGLSRVQRSQLVYSLLKQELSGSVHALAQKLFTLEEWQSSSQTNLAPPPCVHKPS